MAHRLLRDEDADGWERSDFPIICETCLGANPYVRMTKANFDKECKICTRPFTVFRWRPGKDARYKKTEICQTCCKLKNVCQVCLFDLEYGLPVQVRDHALGIDTTDAIPQSDVNREYFAEEHDRKAKAGLDFESSFGKAAPNDLLLKLARTTPYYKRNRAHICSFFVRGECTRGAECPYRHEMPEGGELAHQNMKDRYYGVNDPVANKLLRTAAAMPTLEPPADESIRTLFVGGLESQVTEADLRDKFYGFGELESVRVVTARHCAFVTYTTREGAEKAAEGLFNKLIVKGVRLKVLWGRPRPDEAARRAVDAAKALPLGAAAAAITGGGGGARQGAEGGERGEGGEGGEAGKGGDGEGEGPSGGAAGDAGAAGGGAGAGEFVPRPIPGAASVGPATSASLYPSMNPERMGARVHQREAQPGASGAAPSAPGPPHGPGAVPPYPYPQPGAPMPYPGAPYPGAPYPGGPPHPQFMPRYPPGAQPFPYAPGAAGPYGPLGAVRPPPGGAGYGPPRPMPGLGPRF